MLSLARSAGYLSGATPLPSKAQIRALPNVAPRQAVSFQRKRPNALFGVKAVGSFLPGLTRKAFEKYGFSAASLITDWPAIVGRELAASTAPERLKWPRQVERGEDDSAPSGPSGPASASRGRPGATLVLRVDGAHALTVQYGARQIIERINAYFGYAAVAELRLVQAPVGEGLLPPKPERRRLEPLTAEVAGVADAGLRDALARLGAGIRAGR
jgi:hypothetical protein